MSTNILEDQQYRQAITAVFQQAAAYPEFRARALEDGATALFVAGGVEQPEGVTVTFVENAAEARTEGPDYVLPLLAPSSAEMTDEQLESVAGGGNPFEWPPFDDGSPRELVWPSPEDRPRRRY